jgi:hypothetical protein
MSYKGLILAKGSKALELYQLKDKSKEDLKKFNDHMKDMDKRHKDLMK